MQQAKTPMQHMQQSNPITATRPLVTAADLQDLAVALGRHVLVPNCNEGLNQRRLARLLTGAAQTGAWVLFDNLNCLQPDVLSVFASQLAPLVQVRMQGRWGHQSQPACILVPM